MISDIRKQVELTKAIFGTAQGKELIKLLEEEYTKGSMFRDNQHELYYNVGKHDLIQEIKYFLTLGEQDIKDMEQVINLDE